MQSSDNPPSDNQQPPSPEPDPTPNLGAQEGMQSSDNPPSDGQPPSPPELDPTLSLAAQDVRRLIKQQQQERQLLTNQINILFVTNSALLTFLVLARLIVYLTLFSILEILLFALNFFLLIRAFWPRQFSVSPQLDDNKFFTGYLKLDGDEYQLQMLYDLVKSYNENKRRLDDISQSLSRAGQVSGGIVAISLLHLLLSYFIPEVRQK